MKTLALLLVPAALFGGQPRYARLGEMEGAAEVQLQAADAWIPALRNLVLPERAWVRTAGGARLELELDDGNVFRLTGEAQCELSDYSRLSTGQRVTLISLDRGVGYFTGVAEGRDAVIVAVPGAQVTIRRGARVRLEARDDISQISVIEGSVRFSSPSAELDLAEGQTTRVDPNNTAKFYLFREVTPMDTDRWNEQRDKVLASTASTAHVPGLPYGLTDLDANGAWIASDRLGVTWKPKAPDGWVPFRNGKWRWYEGLGYTWISADSWGWLPSHYGRWVLEESIGWLWVPGKSTTFKPGEVYWMRGADLAGWGPLTVGEEWTGKTIPHQYLNGSTTWAKFAQDAIDLEPSETVRPREPLLFARFAAALPSPAFIAARLDATRPVLRAGSTRIVPHLTGVTFESGVMVTSRTGASARPAEEMAQASQTVVVPPAPQPTVIIEQPPQQPPQEVYYPAPIYTGIVVVNPPEREHRRRPQPDPPPAQKEKPQATPVSAPQPIPRGDSHRRETPPAKAENPPEAAKPIPRGSEDIRNTDRDGGARRN